MIVFLLILGVFGLLAVGFTCSIFDSLTKQGQATGENNRKRMEEED